MIFNIFLQSVGQERNHANHVEDERQELRLQDLLIVNVPIATQKTANKLGRNDLIVLCVV